MTSNVGTKDVKEGGNIGFNFGGSSDDYDHVKNTIEDSVKKLFSPEFINRVDDFIIFRKLAKQDISSIIDIQLKLLVSRLEINQMKLSLTDAAKTFLVDKGFDEKYGARPLKRALQKYIEDELAEEVLKNNLTAGTKVEADYDEEAKKLKFNFSEGERVIDEKFLEKPIINTEEEVEDNIEESK
jgi:ATP-dependent Clp protease ATP-binding subunit ClpC